MCYIIIYTFLHLESVPIYLTSVPDVTSLSSPELWRWKHTSHSPYVPYVRVRNCYTSGIVLVLAGVRIFCTFKGLNTASIRAKTPRSAWNCNVYGTVTFMHRRIKHIHQLCFSSVSLKLSAVVVMVAMISVSNWKSLVVPLKTFTKLENLDGRYSNLVIQTLIVIGKPVSVSIRVRSRIVHKYTIWDATLALHCAGVSCYFVTIWPQGTHGVHLVYAYLTACIKLTWWVK